MTSTKAFFRTRNSIKIRMSLKVSKSSKRLSLRQITIALDWEPVCPTSILLDLKPKHCAPASQKRTAVFHLLLHFSRLSRPFSSFVGCFEAFPLLLPLIPALHFFSLAAFLLHPLHLSALLPFRLCLPCLPAFSALLHLPLRCASSFAVGFKSPFQFQLIIFNLNFRLTAFTPTTHVRPTTLRKLHDAAPPAEAHNQRFDLPAKAPRRARPIVHGPRRQENGHDKRQGLGRFQPVRRAPDPERCFRRHGAATASRPFEATSRNLRVPRHLFSAASLASLLCCPSPFLFICLLGQLCLFLRRSGLSHSS